MRIKQDFVTNSSSTAYVVFVPDGFYPTDEELDAEVEKAKAYWDEQSQPDDAFIDSEIHECLELLKEGSDICSYYNEGVSPIIYDSILEICRSNKFIVNSIEIPCEGSGAIYGISEQSIEKIMINNIDLLSMFKTLQRSEKHVTKKT